jgi:hypothetical protein
MLGDRPGGRENNILHRKKGTLFFMIVACRKSNPNILVMQPAQDWKAKNTPYDFSIKNPAEAGLFDYPINDSPPYSGRGSTRSLTMSPPTGPGSRSADWPSMSFRSAKAG